MWMEPLLSRSTMVYLGTMAAAEIQRMIKDMDLHLKKSSHFSGYFSTRQQERFGHPVFVYRGKYGFGFAIVRPNINCICMPLLEYWCEV